MVESSQAAFVNRDEPIPVLRVPVLQTEASATSQENIKTRKRDVIKGHADKLKNKIDNVREEYKEYKQTGPQGLQEKLLNNLISQIIPAEVAEDGTEVKDRRSRQYVDRPGFSLPLMSSNFRRFNARIGIAFVFQNRLIWLFTWRKPTNTLSFLAVYTLICLQPALIPSVPLALIFFFVMIPSFLARHPPPPPPQGSQSPNLSEAAAAEQHAWNYSYTLRPVAPPQRVKPAPEMSRDFFRNMRDLQNSMEDFSRVHDGAVAVISPYTDFSDEKLSSAVFLAIFILLSLATIAAHLVPWRALALIAGWATTCAGHPKAQEILLSPDALAQIQALLDNVSTKSRAWIESDIALDEPPEISEVEIFELQRLQTPSTTYSYSSPASFVADRGAAEWEPWLFSPHPFDPLSPSRLSGARPAGTQFFEDVQAPRGWRWRDKKWGLDLGSRAWVEERCVTGVEVETEGERWVYDLGEEDKNNEGNSKGKNRSSEEGSRTGKKGEWRRRRWIRLVERKVVKVSPDG